jgi:hypothetical protein
VAACVLCGLGCFLWGSQGCRPGYFLLSPSERKLVGLTMALTQMGWAQNLIRIGFKALRGGLGRFRLQA